ncbi:MAG: AAA family ATPase [Rhodoferax sp.]
MNQNLPPLIQALLQAPRYPGAVQQVELLQTHISWVLLAGDYAYKIKKPVKLHFLDFSTLARRRACCEDELRLNRRFAPDIYLEVLAIAGSPQQPQLGGAGAPIEYAVKMRRFAQDARLDHVCQRGKLGSAHLSDLADTLAAFHAAAAVAPDSSRFGTPDEIAAEARDNFTDLLALLPAACWQARLAALQSWTEAGLTRLAPLMAQRKQAGCVRECHGDLHLANLVLIDQRVRLFDCIEFNDDLRWLDVANEIAFTYVDLLAHGCHGLANWFVNEVLSRSGDYQATGVLRFYAVYRAMVRAKVAAIREEQSRVEASEVPAYLSLAEGLVAVPPARLVITHGLSGCGKTRASDQWLQDDHQAPCLRLRSDIERKRLFGLALTGRSQSMPDAGIYAPEARAQTYARLRDLAGLLLQAGWSVMVDASFLKRRDRDDFRALANQAGVPFAILAPLATPAQLRERILARNALGRDASEATLEVLARQMQVIEPLAPDECRDVLPPIELAPNGSD